MRLCGDLGLWKAYRDTDSDTDTDSVERELSNVVPFRSI